MALFYQKPIFVPPDKFLSVLWYNVATKILKPF